MVYGLPARIVFALWPHTAATSASIRCCITCSPAPTASASRPSGMSVAIPPVPRLPSPAAQGVRRRRIEHSTLIVIGHGGPFVVGVTRRSFDTYHQASSSRPPPQLLRLAGQPLGVTSHPVSLAWPGYWFVVPELSGAPRLPGVVLEPDLLAGGALFSV